MRSKGIGGRRPPGAWSGLPAGSGRERSIGNRWGAPPQQGPPSRRSGDPAANARAQFLSQLQSRIAQWTTNPCTGHTLRFRRSRQTCGRVDIDLLAHRGG
ncbi:hypothetical protein QJS66_19320 [Kocuria rhizophila]|nr:hypothetical protein QJS66_19320 [Kocuria rhizophila]